MRAISNFLIRNGLGALNVCKTSMNKRVSLSARRMYSDSSYTREFIESHVLKILSSYDKIDPNKVVVYFFR